MQLEEMSKEQLIELVKKQEAELGEYVAIPLGEFKAAQPVQQPAPVAYREIDLVHALKSPAASVQVDKQIIADANAYQFLKKHAFNSTRRGFNGPYVCWTLEIPAANEETDSLDSAIAHEMRYTGWAPPYTAPTQPDSGRDAALVAALRKIKQNETEVFDEAMGEMVVVGLDAEEMVAIAAAALSAAGQEVK